MLARPSFASCANWRPFSIAIFFAGVWFPIDASMVTWFWPRWPRLVVMSTTPAAPRAP